MLENYDVEADVAIKFPKIWANLIAGNQITAQTEPWAILLGGQPGAGKSFGSLEMSRRLDFNLLIINGDEFRPYHQFYHEIFQKYGKQAAKYTAEFAGKMVQRVRDEAISQRFNILIEGTFRTIETPLNELNNFKQQGYKTAVLVCTCPKETSWQSTLKRAEQQERSGIQPRYVDRAHFELVVNNLAKNVESVMKLGQPEHVEVYSRQGKLFDSHSMPMTELVSIINQELNRIEG